MRLLLTWDTSNFPSGWLCVRWLSLEKKADSYPKAQECCIPELEGSCKVIPSKFLHPSRNPMGPEGPLPSLGDHQHKSAPSLPWAPFLSLHPLVGRKFSLASNLNPSCVNYLNMLTLHMQRERGQLHLHDRMTAPRCHLSLLFLDANTLVPFFRPGLTRKIAP